MTCWILDKSGTEKWGRLFGLSSASGMFKTWWLKKKRRAENGDVVELSAAITFKLVADLHIVELKFERRAASTPQFQFNRTLESSTEGTTILF